MRNGEDGDDGEYGEGCQGGEDNGNESTKWEWGRVWQHGRKSRKGRNGIDVKLIGNVEVSSSIINNRH